MSALEYLEYLINGQKIDGVPVQTNELELLRTLLLAEKEPNPISPTISKLIQKL